MADPRDAEVVDPSAGPGALVGADGRVEHLLEQCAEPLPDLIGTRHHGVPGALVTAASLRQQARKAVVLRVERRDLPLAEIGASGPVVSP